MVSLRMSIRRNSTSTISWWRRLATRSISVGWPSKGATTIVRLKAMRAVGREKRTKINPVTTANPNIPTTISTVATTWP